MWGPGWRDEGIARAAEPWDMLIIGGGITGAGVLRTATAVGLKALLVDAGDFAFGTSSRSSKLVHGGFRYLYNHQAHVTLESVRERERLLREAPCLIDPLPFTIPNYQAYHFPSRLLHAGIILYDLMAPKWAHQKLSHAMVLDRFPSLNPQGLLVGFRYQDAVLDDARLVLRVIREAVADGAVALNYMRAESLLRDRQGQVVGAVLRDGSQSDGMTCEVQARVVVNASGPWTDELRQELGAEPRLRKLRGSHLIFDRRRFPVNEALTLFHPSDRRAMFVLPWEGVSLVGTTDIDHDPSLEQKYAEPFASRDEIAYMLAALDFLFPGLALSEKDILSSFAGLRPIIAGGADSPSGESRAHQIWNEHGLITISGGKLTTFRIMAHQTVRAALAAIGGRSKVPNRLRMLNPLDGSHISAENLESRLLTRLIGRHGDEIVPLLASAQPEELSPIDDLPLLWAELRWAAAQEGVIHLDDLLLRRVRLGMLLPEGGRAIMPQVRRIAQPTLGWDDARWEQEEKDYWQTWRRYYSPMPG